MIPGRGTAVGCMTAGAVLLLLLAIAASQVPVFYEEMAVLGRRLAEVQKEVQQGLVMEAQVAAFEAEVRKVDGQRETLSRILPVQTDTDAFRKRVEQQAASTGVEATFHGEPAWRPREMGVSAAFMEMTACGRVADAERLLEAVCELVPLTVVERVEAEGGCLRARVVTYAMAPAEAPPRADPCRAAGPSAVRLPPLARRIRGLERSLADACRERERLQAIVARIRAFVDAKAEVERRVGVIEELVAEGRREAWCAPESARTP